jgi:hypothetical protein
MSTISQRLLTLYTHSYYHWIYPVIVLICCFITLLFYPNNIIPLCFTFVLRCYKFKIFGFLRLWILLILVFDIKGLKNKNLNEKLEYTKI